jgi:hypothetical protein
MWSFSTTPRRALDRVRRLTTARRAAPVLALALAATLLVSALGPPAPVGAAAEPAGIAARLQIVIKEVYIHNDRDDGTLISKGDGELRLYAGIWRCNQGIAPPCFNENFDVTQYPRGPEIVTQFMQDGSLEGTAGQIARAMKEFTAGTGETYSLADRLFPQDGDGMWGGNTSPELGFAVYTGEKYVLQFQMHEDDSLASGLDFLGYVLHFIDTQDYGLGLGTHTFRSTADRGARVGDFSVTYEIRRTPLPDIRPVDIKVNDLPNSTEKRVCTVVQNVELGEAGPFQVALYVDGVEASGGRPSIGRLASADWTELCVETQLPTSGEHQLKAVVDEPLRLIEFNETNNVYEQSYTPAPPAPTPTPTPSAALPDLTVGAIRVNGRVPDGKDDCTDGRNDVAVVVKNGGTGKAGDFVVRLVVDGDSGAAKDEEVGDGLDAGQEHEVRFDDVRLRKGERTLTAVADATKGIAESKEDNNELTVTAQCKDDD